MTARLLRFTLFLWTLAVASLGFGQMPNPVKWTATIEPAQAAPGSRVEVVLRAEVEKPWHLYSLKKIENGPFPTSVTVKKGGAIAEVGKTTQAEPQRKFDKNFDLEVEYYEGKAEFRVPVRLAKTAKGFVQVPVQVMSQVCNEGTCLPPTPKSFVAKVEAKGAPVNDTTPLDKPTKGTTKPDPKAAGATAGAAESDDMRSGGLLSYLGIAILAGFGALVTPCVLPMIPITVSFFSKRKDGESPVKKALAYCLGIVGTFTALGVAVSAIFGAAGLTNLANNPWLNMVLAIVFVALAFSLFGFFEIGIPSSVLNKLDSSGRTGFVGPILMGLTFSLTSFTCTLPFVGTVLVSASQGDILWPILGMIAWSSAFALPFFLLALFPSALAKMPRSGAWLGVTKAFLGFVELAAAVKFMSSVDLGIIPGGLGVITREVFLATWFGIAFLAAMYLFGVVRLPKVDDPKIGPFRLGMATLTLVAGGYALLAINGSSMGKLEGFLPPSPYPGREAKSGQVERLAWLDNYEAAVEQAKKEGKPLFIDFTGVFCTNCRDMERNVFPVPAVEERLNKYVLVRLYTDRLTPEDNANQKLLQEKTKSVTLPSYVIVDTSGNEHVTAWTPDPKAFGAFLDRGFNSLSARN